MKYDMHDLLACIGSPTAEEVIDLDLCVDKAALESEVPFFEISDSYELLYAITGKRCITSAESSSFYQFLAEKGLFYAQLSIRPVIRLRELPDDWQELLRRYICAVRDKDSKIQFLRRFEGDDESILTWKYYKDRDILVGDRIFDEYPTLWRAYADIYEMEQWIEEAEKRKVPEEKLGIPKVEHKKNTMERIRACIDADVPLFLHGKPGEGKSQRVLQIDPDSTILELNLLEMGEIRGTIVYHDGILEKKKPIWFEALEKKCEEEPDKIHVLFLDEITNAVPTIQQLAYSLILNKKVAGEWNLPENTRIVVAGNDIEDSSAASEMPEPLKDRMAHIDINTTVKEWLEWATSAQIHPSIIGYIAVKGKEGLRGFSEQRNVEITPRSWEFASKQLKATNDVQDLIPILGEEKTYDFISFIRTAHITKEQIIAGTVTQEEFMREDVATKSAIASRLSDVTMEELPIIWRFIKGGGEEVLSLFQSLWVAKGGKKGREKRLEKICELRAEDSLDDDRDMNIDVDVDPWLP